MSLPSRMADFVPCDRLLQKAHWRYFSKECDRLKLFFARLTYPDQLVKSTISRFIAAKASDQPVSSPAASDR